MNSKRHGTLKSVVIRGSRVPKHVKITTQYRLMDVVNFVSLKLGGTLSMTSLILKTISRPSFQYAEITSPYQKISVMMATKSLGMDALKHALRRLDGHSSTTPIMTQDSSTLWPLRYAVTIL